MQAVSPELVARLLAPKQKEQRKLSVEEHNRVYSGGEFQSKPNGARFYVPTLGEWQATGLCK